MFQKDMDHIDSSAVGGESNKPTVNITQEMAEKNTFFDKPIQKNEKSLTKGKLWKDQPTSKIYNANAIVENEVTGLNRLVKLEIVVEGTSIRFFKHFKLVQSAIKHHTFELTLAHDTLGEAENHNLEEAQNFLGKRITVVFRYKDVQQSPERNFVGVVTEVGFSQDQGSLGNIVLIGESPTILLDAAPHTQSFGGGQEISLNSIAQQVISEGLDPSKFDFRVDASFGNISYSSQYEETHYNYLARVAEAYGEQFFYDGEVLHFGKLPPAENPVKLVYGKNLSDVRIRMKAQHVKPSFYGYNSRKNEKLTGGIPAIKHTSDIAQRAYEISVKTFKTPSLRVAPIKANSFLDVESSQKGTAGSKASEVFITTGISTVPFLYPGCTADMEMRKAESSETSYFTRLLLTEVVHEVDARGYYSGRFEAIAADSGYIPRPEFIVPKAEPQFGKVVSNSDPLNQGRVKVQFDWQQGKDSSEFIRVMSPDAGSSEDVKTNRGFMSVPEVGDQVMVNFVYQHPDRPFVMGGLFHGGSGAGGGSGNNIMSFSGRSGAELKYDNGAGSMNLKDKGGANMHFDGTGNATTDANLNHVVNAGSTSSINVGAKENNPAASIFDMDDQGNISFKGKKSLTITIGNSSLKMKEDGTISLTGKDITVTGSNNLAINATPSEKGGGSGTIDITSKGGDITISNDKNINVKGGIEVKLT
ncbi:type VI secretion system Vgr family protein [Sphingobacterium sp. UGAL515B_05]|uniref:type VI secretion system Vgr family protein n=1 Tax=Sphingobacterium sp. UGAL515B_05 TaxID=2986767 RepID=UPI002952A244|nr:phage baseplate assembly protein V [Sphingobacterium sp. UGAL515B_05]WON94337.1 phage baseplate assembly protein V [Sphingobacterium sp. UGAL515B_05]